MPRSCCVPGCKINYYSCATKGSVFRFPRDEQRRQQWIKAIHRKDFTPTPNTVVCEKHFEKRFIITKDSITRLDGTVITAKRGTPTLTNDAYPTIFPNQPKYMSKETPPARTNPQKRKDKVSERDELKFQTWMANDTINSFDEFANNFMTKLSKDWLFASSDGYVSFLKVSCEDQPKLIVSFKVLKDLNVLVWYENTALDQKTFKWLLGSENKCDRWSKFENLLSHLNSYPESAVTDVDKLTQCIKVIKQLLETDSESDKCSKRRVLWFCAEQLNMFYKEKMRYSSEFLVWAYSVYLSSPSLYIHLRDSKVLILPHPDYLRKLDVSSTKSLCTENSHEFFLRENLATLNSEEKFVNVLLDEIHVKKCLAYKGGKIYGASVNSCEPATTIQVFMISSLLSKHKHVAALYPVCNLTANTLLELTHKVLAFLHDIGYIVLSLISDNNRVNRNMFEKICGGTLATSIPNPYNSSVPLFFLFDSVHLLKCIRNNWLNQKNPIQTFVIPSPSNFQVTEKASLLPLKELYAKERNQYVKLAPGLSEKVLFPTNLERQNVQLVVRLFDEKNVAAMKTMNISDVSGTVTFLEQIISWWHIVNVKSPTKGIHLRQKECNPIRQDSSTDPNLIFLSKFQQWLRAWEELDMPQHGRMGKLSRETCFALSHTTSALITLCDYLLKHHKFHYVLLGKFQTDKLEGRFGQYRKMSGTNYNVAVAQVMESEKKLKIMNVLSMASSKAGPLTISALSPSPSESTSKCDSLDYLEKFKEVEEYVMEEEILSKEDENVLIYISGYVAHSIKKKVNCELCLSRISLDKIIEADFPDNCQYLKILDRGGLKWPTDFTLSVCISTYQVFQALIGHFKNDFLQCNNQRQVLVKLALNFQTKSFDVNECCSCSRSVNSLLRLCIWPLANILLNNFTKSYNNAVSHQKGKKRKLSTLEH